MVCLRDSEFQMAEPGFKTKDWQINGTFKYFKLKKI